MRKNDQRKSKKTGKSCGRICPAVLSLLILYASPDGANRANELLSERRADSLSSWIVRHGSVPASLIDRQAAGIAWDELRAQVAASGMLYRDEVLDVLDNTPVWIFDEKNQVVGGRMVPR